MTAQFTFYNRTEYFKELTKAAQSAGTGDRIAVTTMTYDPSDLIVAELIETLTGAAARGAEVVVCADAYSLLVNEKTKWPGPLWYRPNLHARMWQPFRNRLATLETLRKHGGKYTFTNMPKKAFSVIPAGRSHMKLAVVNNRVFVGGCNLREATEIDVMASWHDAKTADWLYNTVLRMYTSGGTSTAFGGKDRTFSVSPAATLLLDSGKPKQSIIYDHALELIDNAKEWLYFTCQYFPGGRTGRHLLAALKRGVDVKVIYSHPRTHGRDAAAMYAYNLRERSRLPAPLFAGRTAKNMPRLHAKVLASENGAIVGSHNYITQGVTFGTAELALQVMDPRLSTDLTDFMKRML